MANRRLNTPADKTAAILQESMGGCGAVKIGAGSNVNGDFVAFTVIADNSGSGSISTTGSPTLTTDHVPAGVTIFGSMSNITTGGGTAVIAYTTCR